MATRRVTTRGGASFYFELPWRSTSHKMGYWGDDETIENFAYAFMKGVGGVAGWDLFSPDITVEAADGVVVTGAQSRAAFGTTAMTGTATLTTSGSVGRHANASTALSATHAMFAAGVAQFPGIKFGMTAITGLGTLYAEGFIELSPDRFGVSAILAYGVLTAVASGTGTAVRRRARVFVSI